MEEKRIVKTKESLGDLENKHLTFWINAQLYALPISYVIQIVGMQEITSIPEFTDYMKGIITIRNEVIPIMDLRLRFSLPEVGYTERTCIIICELGSKKLGIIVDEVDAVCVIAKAQISNSFKTVDSRNDFVVGVAKIDKKVILLLNRNKVFGIEDYDSPMIALEESQNIAIEENDSNELYLNNEANG